jgi:hypothetical protein
MVFGGRFALTGRVGRHSTTGLAVVAAAGLALAQLDEGVGRSHPRLHRERRFVGDPVGHERSRVWSWPGFVTGLGAQRKRCWRSSRRRCPAMPTRMRPDKPRGAAAPSPQMTSTFVSCARSPCMSSLTPHSSKAAGFSTHQRLSTERRRCAHDFGSVLLTQRDTKAGSFVTAVRCPPKVSSMLVGVPLRCGHLPGLGALGLHAG